MGPLATCTLLETIIKYTDADRDQDHVHVMLDCNTNVPDRTAAILNGGQSPVPELVATGKRLVNAGAEVLVMHCNTSHYFYDQVAPEVGATLLHMPRETAKYLASLGVKKAGVLATTGTCKAGVYEKALAEAGMESVYPTEEGQELLMSTIYDYIKAGRLGWDVDGIRAMLADMRSRGAEQIIIGCTEIPMILRGLSEFDNIEDFTEGTGFVDPTIIVAKAAIEAAGYKVR